MRLALGAVTIATLSVIPAAFGRGGQSATPDAQAKAAQPGMIPAPPPPLAETANAAMSKDAGTNQLEVGTAICAVLTRTVDAKKAKVGDKVAARATLAVLSHGRVLIAEGAKITGHVTKAKARSSADPQSEVILVFDRVALKSGGEMQLPLTVQAIGYSGVNMKLEDETANYDPYSPPPMIPDATSSAPIRRSSIPRPQGQTTTRPQSVDGRDPEGLGTAATALDVGSKGVVGLPGLTLTEGTDARRGSEVTSSIRNVKLESGSQLVLRVIKDKEEGRS